MKEKKEREENKVPRLFVVFATPWPCLVTDQRAAIFCSLRLTERREKEMVTGVKEEKGKEEGKSLLCATEQLRFTRPCIPLLAVHPSDHSSIPSAKSDCDRYDGSRSQGAGTRSARCQIPPQ